MRRFLDVPPVWFLGGGIAAHLLARFAPIAVFALPDWIGWLVAAAGLLWAIAAAGLFLRRRTPVEPRHAPLVLLVEGPFRLNRNPIYTGMTVMLVGWALLLGAASAFLPAALFPVVVTLRFIRDEERALVAAFGTEAEAYLARTRRW